MKRNFNLCSFVKSCICFGALLLIGVNQASAQNIVAEQAAKIKPLADGSVRFAYLADIHIAKGTTSIADMEASVSDINSLKDIQFVILAGDITEFGSDEEIAIAAGIFAKFNKPWFILSGNHDSKWSESGCNTFAKVFGYEFFNFVVPTVASAAERGMSGGGREASGREASGREASGSVAGRNVAGRSGANSGIRFIGCNSGPNMRMAPALVPRESILLLDSVARVVPKDQPVIFINHYPLDDQMLNWFEVTGILKRMNTQLAMCGHGHNNMVLDFDGIPAVMGRSNLRAGRAGAGYNIVTIRGGQIDFQERVVAVSGVASESGSFGNTAAAANAGSTNNAGVANNMGAANNTGVANNIVAAGPKATAVGKSADAQSNKTLAPWFRLRMSAGPAYGSGRNDNSGRASGSIGTPDSDHDVIFQELFAQNANSPVREVWSLQDNSDIGSAALYVPRGDAPARIPAYSSSPNSPSSNSGSAKSSTQKSPANNPPANNPPANNPSAINSSAKNSLSSGADISYGIVYYANTAGVVKAVRMGSVRTTAKDILWSYATSGKIFSSPAVDQGRLVIGSSDGYVYCLDALKGTLLWKVAAKKSVLASPAIYKGIVYIGASDGIFRAIDLLSGRLVWSFDGVEGFVESKAFVDNSGVYFGSWGSRFYALNPKNGKLLWSWTNGKGRGLSPAAVWPVKGGGKLTSGTYSGSGAKIYFVTPERMTHALDAATGRELWRARGGREAIGLSPDASTIYIKTMQDTVIAYSTRPTAQSASAAKSSLPSASRNTPPPPADYLANPASAQNQNQNMSYNQNKIQNIQTPPVLWKSHAGFGYEIAPSPITTTAKLIFIPTDKGDIIALRASDGSIAWRYKFSIALINYIQPLPGNRLLVSSMDGKVGVLAW